MSHYYNHQNGTHRELFRIQEVQFKKFIDDAYHSHAFFDNITAPYTFIKKLRKPDLFVIPDVIRAHLENYFPSLVMLDNELPMGKVAQFHLFVPESETRTRTYVITYGIAKSPVFNLFKKTALNFAKVVVEQDANILGRLYPNTPQKIRLNNEVGMDWIRRNFEHWPEVIEPSLSR